MPFTDFSMVETGISVLPIVAAELTCEQAVNRINNPALATAISFFNLIPDQFLSLAITTGAIIEFKTSIVHDRAEVSPTSSPGIQFGAAARATKTVDIAFFTKEPG